MFDRILLAKRHFELLGKKLMSDNPMDLKPSSRLPEDAHNQSPEIRARDRAWMEALAAEFKIGGAIEPEDDHWVREKPTLPERWARIVRLAVTPDDSRSTKKEWRPATNSFFQMEAAAKRCSRCGAGVVFGPEVKVHGGEVVREVRYACACDDSEPIADPTQWITARIADKVDLTPAPTCAVCTQPKIFVACGVCSGSGEVERLGCHACMGELGSWMCGSVGCSAASFDADKRAVAQLALPCAACGQPKTWTACERCSSKEGGAVDAACISCKGELGGWMCHNVSCGACPA